MLKSSSTESSKPKKGGVGISDDNKARRDSRCKIDRSEISDNEIDDQVDDEFDDRVDDEFEKKGRNPSKTKNLSKPKKTELDFFTFGSRMAFTKLRQAIIKAPILYHLNPEYHI